MKTSTRTSSSTNGPAPEPALDTEAQPIPKGMTLSSYIRDRFEDFSRSQKDVARYIVDHLEEAAFQTAEELARRADTSSSTVVRFSQALGFDGFPELQEAARDEYKRRTHAPAGVCWKRGANADIPTQWLMYIHVADLDASILACGRSGGAVLVG